MNETILQIIPAYGWTALLAVKGRWPRRVRLERWPMAAWALVDCNGDRLVEPVIVAGTEGFGELATYYLNFVALIGPGDRVRREYWQRAREIMEKA